MYDFNIIVLDMKPPFDGKRIDVFVNSFSIHFEIIVFRLVKYNFWTIITHHDHFKNILNTVIPKKYVH